MAYSTTDERIYLVQLTEPYERLTIQFVPQQIEISRTANVQDIVVVGRNNPLHQYTSGDDSLALRLSFYADQEDRKDVQAKCRWLMALGSNNGGRAPQPRVKLVWGDLFKRSKWIVTSVRCNWTLFDREYGFLPRLGTADITFKLDTDANVPWSDLREIQSR